MSIFQLLVVILVLGNMQFVDTDSRRGEEHCTVSNPLVLDHAACLLGIPIEELQHALTNRSNYVRRELYSVLLGAEQAARQCDGLARNLYAILFAFVVETANHKIAPAQQDPTPTTQISLLVQPGVQLRAPTDTSSMALSSPLIAAHGQNGFKEFMLNFRDKLVHSYIFRHTFEDSVVYNSHVVSDGVALPAITTLDNSACVELLRGIQVGGSPQRKPASLLGTMSKAAIAFKSGKLSKDKDDQLLRDIVEKFGTHTFFATSPTLTVATEGRLFGINHYAGNCLYDTSWFVEKYADTLDSAFVSLLRHSTESFVAKLVSGPSLATENHYQDESIVVQAQVSSRPLRHPTCPAPRADDVAPLDPSKVYPVTTQLNYNLSDLLATIEQTKLWTVLCIRPNDSMSPNSFDKRRVKAEIRSLLLPDVVRGCHAPSEANIFGDPSAGGYAAGGLSTPGAQHMYHQGQDGSGWGSDWDVKRGISPPPSDRMAESKESAGLMVNEKQNTVEEIPQSRSRCVWIVVVWMSTWWIHSFLIHHVGRMKRPDVRFAWREKVTICLIILSMCGTILFYIIVFGRLLCPNLDKAWNSDQVLQHQGTNDFYVSIQGEVYDISSFQGDHSDIPAAPVTSDDQVHPALLDIHSGALM